MANSVLTQSINIDVPIIQAPMAGGATTPELIAEVSNAGGLGSLGAGYMAAENIRTAIKKIRSLTSKPFAVNLFIPNEHHSTTTQIQQACQTLQQTCTELNLDVKPVTPPYCQNFAEQIKVIIEESVPIFSFTFGSLESHWIKKLKNNNTVIIGTATSVAEAELLEQTGIDMICAQGIEAGGHRGNFLNPESTSLQTLVKELKTTITRPIIAAGGLMTASDIQSILALGADAAQLGTAFLSCPEAGVPECYKKVLLAQTHDNTVLTRAFSGKQARGIANKFTTRMQNHTNTILDYPIQNALTKPIRATAKKLENTDFMSLWAGQKAYLSRSLPVKKLMQELYIN